MPGLSRGCGSAVDVEVVGGAGKVGGCLLQRLAAAGHRARGVVRKPEQVDAVAERGAEGILFDLEGDKGLASRIEDADAVVFAAGAGPGSGAARKRTVDFGGATTLIDACRAAGIARYVMVSSIGAHDPAGRPEAMRPYLEAKAEADRALAASGLDYTIVRPGRLTDDPGTGRIRAGLEIGRGETSRDDVAATLLAVLDADNTIGKTFEVLRGDAPIEEAVRAL